MKDFLTIGSTFWWPICGKRGGYCHRNCHLLPSTAPLYLYVSCFIISHLLTYTKLLLDIYRDSKFKFSKTLPYRQLLSHISQGLVYSIKFTVVFVWRILTNIEFYAKLSFFSNSLSHNSWEKRKENQYQDVVWNSGVPCTPWHWFD